MSWKLKIAIKTLIVVVILFVLNLVLKDSIDREKLLPIGALVMAIFFLIEKKLLP